MWLNHSSPLVLEFQGKEALYVIAVLSESVAYIYM
jgi:hypothetical protein